jgi:hypothetical protein
MKLTRIFLMVPAFLPPVSSAAQDVTASPAVVEALRELDRACRAEAGELWGVSLCGPVLLVDRATRHAIANRADDAGVLQARGDFFAGVLPADVMLANTGVDWGGGRWAMILLPLPEDRFARVALLVHEVFHRIQPQLGLPARNVAAPHLDERDGRFWLRLELRALSRALETSGDARRQAAGDALTFRAARHRRFPGADTIEAALELNEGLASYTGAKVALRFTGDSVARVARDVAAGERRRSFARAFAYDTGPALGLLLDDFSPGWRTNVRAIDDLAAALARALGWQPPAALERIAAERAPDYDGAALAADEDARAEEARRRIAELRARLIDGPVVVLRQEALQMAFDPTRVTALGDAGNVYFGNFSGPWGALEVSAGGVLVAPDFRAVRVPAPGIGPLGPVAAGDEPLRGDGWVLRLTPGWSLVRRGGDLEAAPPGGR